MGYDRVDIVADTYKDDSIKSAERIKRGFSREMKISSPQSKVPSDFNIILNNGNNKTQMIELIRDVIETNKVKYLKRLGCKEIYFSTHNECKKFTSDAVSIENELNSNQEEADTKVILHSKHAFDRSPEKTVIVRSPSGDIDIIILMIGMFIDHPEHFYIDTGSGKHRKGFRLSEIILSTEIKLSLLGFHAFTGNYYVSSFYQKGKVICWRVLEKYPKFLQAFQDLGSNWELQDSTF